MLLADQNKDQQKNQSERLLYKEAVFSVEVTELLNMCTELSASHTF